ncbi:MAG: M48 family metallopeptidase [Nitrospirales bacterium]|nr:M48 family metallopeptidase [Nitrospirales bacterium]
MPSPASPTSWSGHYFDGRTTARHPVTIILAPSGLELHIADGARAFWPYGDITQTQGAYANEPVRLERGSPIPEAVIVEDPAFLEALQRFARENARQFDGPRHRGSLVSLVVLAGAASIAVIAGLFLWGIPALAELVTPIIPTSWETALGESVVQQLAPIDRRCADGRLRDSVDSIMARLEAARPDSPYRFHVTVVDGPVFNAFAAPGGQIVLFRKMLQSAERPEDLAGVLAHEMQHIYHRHAMKALVRDLSVAAIVGAVFGDITGIGALAVAAGRTLTTLHYSRETETEADREGLRLLQAARVDPAGMVRFFETLKKHTGDAGLPAYLSTHPDTEQRLAEMKALAEATPVQSEPLLADVKWDEVRKLCR